MADRRKRILVTGKNSFIGNAFMRYMEDFPEYELTGLSLRDGTWKTEDFSSYDCVFHVAGLAHADSGKITEAEKRRYYAINTDLTLKVAEKAKAEGVRQFIFMSSAIVYGDSAPVGKSKLIDRNTPPCPAGAYGDSKYQAELGLQKLETEDFRVVILRPPMIYGKGCKGNYPLLAKLARKTPVFPRANNQRSMLYVGNLVRFVRLMIRNDERGIFWPQNEQYSDTGELVQMIARAHGRSVLLIPATVPLVILSHMTGLVNKAFGSLAYSRELSEYREPYCEFSLQKSIELTES